MPIDPISADYIRLSFALDQHVHGVVDAYIGPADLRPTAPPAPAKAILAALEDLHQRVQTSSYPRRRKDYLAVQIRGLVTVARRLAGETLSYRDEVRDCFDIDPCYTPDERFEAALVELDAVLPGWGDLAARMHRWRTSFDISPTVALQMIGFITTEVRHRTQAITPLPTQESVEFVLVSDKPWSGYNWYLGRGRSRVEVNVDLPLRANTLLDLICHEAYPGHHTEHLLKEQHLFTEQGWGEQSIQLITAPECVISEGIATLAVEAIFGNEANTWAAEHLYPLGGITSDPERDERIMQASAHMRALSGNAALMIYEQGVAPDAVVPYLMRYGLRSEQEARQQLRFICDPLWRTYVFTYFVGRDLLGRWLRRGDRAARFRTLLTEQIYPSLVEGWLLEEDGCVRG